MSHNEMQVIKRNGDREDVSFDKVMNRLKKLSIDSKFEHKLKVNVSMVAQKVCSRIYNGVTTSELDELAAQICASLITENPDYGSLASRIVISNHHKSTSPSLSETIYILFNNRDIHGNKNPLVSPEIYNIVMENKNKLNDIINYQNDYLFDYFGFKTLERAYLLKINKKIIERPQQMLMRVALGIHLNDFKDALNTYKLMSEKYFIHATPTLFNSGTQRPQLSSCFLMGVDDSIASIYKSLSDCASISKWAGGIGIHVHDIRAKSSLIRGTNGYSNGLTPMLRVFNNTARYVDQCLKPSTYVHTTQGPQQICNLIAKETQIINDQGKTEVIDNVLEHYYQGQILSIITEFSINDFEITPEHPVLSICVKEHDDTQLIPQKLKRKLLHEEYNEAGKLSKGDFIAISIPKYEVDNQSLVPDDCYIYGLLLASNSCEQLYKIEIKKTNTEYSKIIKFCQDYLDSRLVEYQLIDDSKNTNISWKDSLHLPFRYSNFFNTNCQKYISKEWINLPLEKCQQIIRGYFHLKGKNMKNSVLIDLPLHLSQCFRYLLLRLKTPSVVKELTKGKFNLMFVPRTNIVSSLLGIDNVQKNTSFFIHNDRIYQRIGEIKSNHFEGRVYDLQMRKIHSYTTSNATVHNGGGKRNGSFAIYLEPWHADIKNWLQLKKNHGNEEERARDLFYGLWIPDLFMKRVQENQSWTLMCPDQCPGLTSCHGEEFNDLYQKYEQEGRGIETIDAQELWSMIVTSQIETGTPYMLYKDACNLKSNQQNLGTIKSSNLCTEIIEYSDSKETAVCNLASIGLPTFLEYDSQKKQQSYQIYTKSKCNFCKIAKMILKNQQIEYQEINLDDDQTRNDFFEKLRSQQKNDNLKTVPQIYIDDTWIGGCQQLMEYLKPTFNFEKLIEVTKTITKNLNKVIDRNYYPTPETLLSNKKHRPIGIGVQGLADVFLMMKIAFDSPEARELNEKIFESIYYGAVCESMNISKKREVSMIRYKELLISICDYLGINMEMINSEDKIDLDKNIHHFIISKKTSIPDEFKKTITEFQNLHEILKPIPQELNRQKFLGAYSTFEGSPISQGKLQFDLWNYQPNKCNYDWTSLKEEIQKSGVRNSLLLAPMPTASTSQILGNNECFEPFTSNIYTRRTLAGEFIIVNKYLLQDLNNLGVWNMELKNKILTNDGSINNIEEIPETIRNIYKTVWDIKQKCLIDMSADRAKFICQSQSLNLFLSSPNLSQISSMHFYAWKSGLKTGMYYLRTKPASSAQKFTIEPENNCEACSA